MDYQEIRGGLVLVLTTKEAIMLVDTLQGYDLDQSTPDTRRYRLSMQEEKGTKLLHVIIVPPLPHGICPSCGEEKDLIECNHHGAHCTNCNELIHATVEWRPPGVAR